MWGHAWLHQDRTSSQAMAQDGGYLLQYQTEQFYFAV
jgi:hypothetical protein